jgi:hypothetical protein
MEVQEGESCLRRAVIGMVRADVRVKGECVVRHYTFLLCKGCCDGHDWLEKSLYLTLIHTIPDEVSRKETSDMPEIKVV